MTKKCCKCKLEWNVSQVAYKDSNKSYICPNCEHLIRTSKIKDTFKSVLLSNKKRWGNRIG